MHAYMAWSQKFRKSEISLDIGIFNEVSVPKVMVTTTSLKNIQCPQQARDPLGSLGGAKTFLRGAHIFWTSLCPIISNHVQYIFPGGGEKFSRGGFAPPAPPWLRAWPALMESQDSSRTPFLRVSLSRFLVSSPPSELSERLAVPWHQQH